MTPVFAADPAARVASFNPGAKLAATLVVTVTLLRSLYRFSSLL